MWCEDYGIASAGEFAHSDSVFIGNQCGWVAELVSE